jgi:arylsulfatase
MANPLAEGWLEPSETFNFTLVQNIKRDPFEQAVGPDQESSLSLGGSLDSPSTAFIYNWNMLPIGQQLALKFLESYETYPPLQAPPSYNLAQVMEQIDAQKRAITTKGHVSD